MASATRAHPRSSFFQAVRAMLVKHAPGERKTDEELDHAIRQIVSRAVISDEVVDIFAAAGLKKPDISILSDEFLAEVRDMPQRNLAVELLQKLLKGEIRTRSRKNVVLARSFAEMLEQTIRRYQNRAIEAAQVIEELITLAKDLRELDERGIALDLTEDELAFYDALETNDSAVKVLGDETLRDYRPRAGGCGPLQRHHRLDHAGERARPPAGHREAYPAQVWLSARQARESHPHGVGAGRGA